MRAEKKLTEMSRHVNNDIDDSELENDDNHPLLESNELEIKDGSFPKARQVFALIGKNYRKVCTLTFFII